MTGLTDAKLRTLTQRGKHFDGGGLFLLVMPSGGRYWRFKYRFGGKEKLLALGVYPAVGLKEARERAAAARRTLDAESDPGAERKAAKARVAHEAGNTLQAVAADWLQHQASRWTPHTVQAIDRSLRMYIFPTLGQRPLASIKPGEIQKVVQTIEAKGAGDMAGRVLQRVKAICRWAVTQERIESNPLADMLPAEILKPRKVRHRLALPEREIPAFLARLAAYDGDVTTRHALRLLMLTAVRPGELRGARWAEFDLDAALWVIPAERMKMRVEHRVPLSRQALAVLRNMQPLTGDGDLVFPSPSYPSKPLSENTFNSAMARMGYKGIATAHGFRALLSTVANEAGWDGDVIERQLTHIEGNKVRAAYHRSMYTKERARLMQWWADFIDQRGSGSNVVPLPLRVA